MRFDKRVTFYQKGTDKYNPETGEYDGAPVGMVRNANVTDYPRSKQVTEFGSLTFKLKVIRTIAPPPDDWEYLTIAGIGTDSEPIHFRLQSGINAMKSSGLIVGEANE